MYAITITIIIAAPTAHTHFPARAGAGAGAGADAVYIGGIYCKSGERPAALQNLINTSLSFASLLLFWLVLRRLSSMNSTRMA